MRFDSAFRCAPKGSKRRCPLWQETAESSDFQRITALFGELDFQNDRALVVYDLPSPGATPPDGRSAGPSSAALNQGIGEKKDISAKFLAVEVLRFPSVFVRRGQAPRIDVPRPHSL